MKPALILVSHGNLSAEIVESAKMILGELNNYAVVSMKAEDGFEGTERKFQECLDKLVDKDILVLADLYGGTPFNIANIFLKKIKNMRLIAGMNLSMVIEYFSSNIENIDELVKELLKVGKDAVLEPSENDDDIELD